MSGSSLDSQLGQVLADFSNDSCYGSGSFYIGYVGQCTWYCWGRAKEKFGESITFNGSNNGGEWYVNASNCAKVGPAATPVDNFVASFIDGSYGHVVFIEGVEGDTVYFTEANVDNIDGDLASKSIAEFQHHLGKTLNGYLLLE